MRKAMELSLNTIVIAAVILITMIVMIMIFSGGASDFVSGLFNIKCSSKLKALCAPQGAGDDKNGDSISDSAQFSLDVDDTGIAIITGQCANADGAPSDAYKKACSDWSKLKKTNSKPITAGR